MLLFLVVIIEAVYLFTLNMRGKSTTQTVTDSSFITKKQDQSSDQELISVIKKIKNNNISLNELYALINGNSITKKPIVQSYVVSLTAKGVVSSIDFSNDKVKIILLNEQNSDDALSFYYGKEFFSRIRFVPDSLTLEEIKTGDTLTITDSVDIKTGDTIGALITK